MFVQRASQVSSEEFEIFLMAPPGLERALQAEALEQGFPDPQVITGGVTFQGGWPDVWRANLCLRGAGRVLARIGSFRAFHLAQLDKRARKFPWTNTLRADRPIRVEVTCRKSKIYHAKAATQRIEKAISETLGSPISKDAQVCLKVRIEDDLCTLSIDTSGTSLHKRGHKVAVNKAPMRETLAALFLRESGYDGQEPVYDPMCGSGTFVIEAAEIALGIAPGRDRDFAFQHLASFNPDQWTKIRSAQDIRDVSGRFYGSDRDAGAIKMSTDNATRAGVDHVTQFTTLPISDIRPPEGPAGLIIVNPPYGARIGNKKLLFGLYGALGKVLMDQFSGWRVGVITSDAGLAKATSLPFLPNQGSVVNGSLKITLYQTSSLP